MAMRLFVYLLALLTPGMVLGQTVGKERWVQTDTGWRTGSQEAYCEVTETETTVQVRRLFYGVEIINESFNRPLGPLVSLSAIEGKQYGRLHSFVVHCGDPYQ